MTPTALGVVASGVKAAGWSPLTLSPHMWFDADDAATFTYSSGVVVSQWRDKSGNARHLTNGTLTRDGTLNGRPTVRNSGTNGGLYTIGTSFPGIAYPYTVLCVLKLTGSAGTQRTPVMLQPDGRIYCPTSGNIAAYQGATYDSGVAWGAAARNVGVIFNGDANSKMAIEANTWGTGRAMGNGAAPTSFYLGSNTSIGEQWVGLIAEVTVVARAITDTELAQWRVYCTTKWGTA